MEEIAPQKTAEYRVKKEKPFTAKEKNRVQVVVLGQVLALIIIGLIMQTLNGMRISDRVSTLGGVVLIIGAADFLLMRKLLFGKKEIEAGAVEKPEKYDKKVMEKPECKESKSMNRPAHIPAASNSNVTEVFGVQSGLETVLLDRDIDVKRIAFLKSMREDSDEKIILSKPSFMIGRLKDQVDYVSQNRTVGKMHAELTRRNGRYFVKDLNSKNGTKINGVRINSNIDHEIKSSDKVAFANSEYVFVCEALEE